MVEKCCFYSAASLIEIRKWNPQASGLAQPPRVWRRSGTRRLRVWRKSTVACDFTLGPDPSNHCAPDFTLGPDPRVKF